MFKKIISSIMALAIMASIGTTVMAGDVDAKDYVVTYSAEEVTDTDTLLAMAISEKFNSPEKALDGQFILPRSNFNSEINNANRTIYQVLERRLYSNGMQEEDRVATSLITTRDVTSGTGSGNNVSAVNKLYFTQRAVDPLYPWATEVLAQYASTTIVNQLSTHSVRFDNSIHVYKYHGSVNWSAINTVTNPSLHREYFVYPSGSPEYISIGDTAGGLYSGCEVYVNGQYTFDVFVRVI